jgi:homoserine kinase
VRTRAPATSANLGPGFDTAGVALDLWNEVKVTGQELPLEDLLARGGPLEGHSDNLAACLAGGVCLTWEGRIARIADTLPLTPVAVIPDVEVKTAEARLALPAEIPHADATFNVARAALLGAGMAAGRTEWLAAAFEDRLHQPYRPSPLLDDIRAELPRGAAGATLSGSGPTVIVWAEDADACAAELSARYETVLTLPVVAEGAH